MNSNFSDLISENLISIIFLITFIGTLIFFFFYLLQIIKKYSERQKSTEQKFERMMLSEFQKTLNKNETLTDVALLAATDIKNTSSGLNFQSSSTKPEQTTTPGSDSLILQSNIDNITHPPSLSEISKSDKENMRIATDKIISRLSSAGIVKNIEGPFSFGLRETQIMLVHLTSGRTVLIIPYFESETFILQNIQKYDYIIMILKNGEPIVTERINQFLADKIA